MGWSQSTQGLNQVERQILLVVFPPLLFRKPSPSAKRKSDKAPEVTERVDKPGQVRVPVMEFSILGGPLKNSIGVEDPVGGQLRRQRRVGRHSVA